MRIRRSFFLSALCSPLFALCFQSSSLAAITVGELQEKMVQSEAALRSVKFDYVQEMRSELSPEVRHSSGSAYFKKPKMIRIEQKEPEAQLIVSSGKTIFIYTPRFQQALKDSWNRWTSKNLLFPGLVTFSDTFQRLKRDYDWEIASGSEVGGEKTLMVNLKPPRSDKSHSLKLWVSEADFIPRKTEWREETLTLTTTLVSLQANPELKPDLFEFKRPPNTEVIPAP